MKDSHKENLHDVFDTEESEEKFITLAAAVKTKLRRDIYEYLCRNPGSGSKRIMEDLNYTKGQVLRALKIMKESGIVIASFDDVNFRYTYTINAKNCEFFTQRFQYLLDVHPEPEDIMSFIKEKYKPDDYIP